MEQELSKAQSQQSAPGLAGQPAAVAEALAREQRERRYITASGIDIRESALSLAEEYERPEGILVQESSDAPLMTREGLSLVLGPPKCRKTSLCVGIVAALLGHPLLGLYSPDEEKAGQRVVLMFDTEQGRGYAQMTYRKVHKLMGWDTHRNNSRLVYIDLRPFTREQRVEMVRTAIEAYRPQVVFIDGIVDLCGDYNDQKECSTLMNLLLELAGSYGMHICSCLHTNKDGHTERGTLGAMYKQKAETTFYVKGYQEYSEVKPAEGGCRQKPFTPFFFSLTDGFALPVLWKGDIEEAVEESTLERAMRYTEAAFVESGHREMKFGELFDYICKEASKDTQMNITRPSFHRYLDELLERGFIRRIKFGVYALCDPDDNQDQQQELPFEEVEDVDDDLPF